MTAGNYYLYVNGGYIVIDALGDGVDINGSIVMTGGTLIVNGPTQNMNGALDYDASFNISGGFSVGSRQFRYGAGSRYILNPVFSTGES